ncbi:hypothetical protein B0J11DRAFT_573865 [Dendryphion nanum]|uniref:Uncharacterized protein n=1 Tax=Dendryphion nanum TaxID=256645 RepID=A0A9P9CXG8_9PLEO|nr:hypothetical protein B0J11DRAFT_573865 [Dendryphion nanum]
MSLTIAGFRIDLLQLWNLPLREPLRSRRRKLRKATHRWTTEEQNFIVYLRLHRNWTWGQIHRTYFSSVSIGAVKSVYSRIPPEDRANRASIISLLIIDHRNTASVRRNTRGMVTTHSASRQRPSHPSRPISGLSQPRDNVEAVLSASSSEDENRPFVNDITNNHYNLRPNRPKKSQENGPQYRKNCLQSPRFSRSCESHSKLRTLSDNYIHPQHSPTPDVSGRDPSVVSSQLSGTSSLELFGLEARVLSPSDCSSLVMSDGSSSEFFSAEEHLTLL